MKLIKLVNEIVHKYAVGTKWKYTYDPYAEGGMSEPLPRWQEKAKNVPVVIVSYQTINPNNPEAENTVEVKFPNGKRGWVIPDKELHK